MANQARSECEQPHGTYPLTRTDMEELKSLPTTRRANCTGLSGNPDAMVRSKIVRETSGNELYHVTADPCER